MLTVTERIPHDYRYRCQVDLNLTADNIFAKTDVYPITVSGKPPLAFMTTLIEFLNLYIAGKIRYTVHEYAALLVEE